MGADANVLAIGTFSKDIAHLLDYPEDNYNGVPEGYPVVTTLFPCNTTDQSRILCHALGCKWIDFSTFFLRFKDTAYIGARMFHRMTRMDGVVVSLNDLRDIQRDCGFAEWDENEVEKFIILAAKGFRFIFQPNY